MVRLDTDALKSWVHARIRWPVDQPGGWHIPQDADDAYCRQIVSEARVRKASGGFAWTPLRPDNHYLDCEALAYGAAKMIGLERVRAEPVSRVPATGQPDAVHDQPAPSEPAPASPAATTQPAVAPAAAPHTPPPQPPRSMAPGFMRRPNRGWLQRG